MRKPTLQKAYDREVVHEKWGGGRYEAGAATLGPQAEGVNSVVAWTIEPSALPARFPLLSAAAALSGGSYSQLAEQFRMQTNDN